MKANILEGIKHIKTQTPWKLEQPIVKHFDVDQTFSLGVGRTHQIELKSPQNDSKMILIISRKL